MKSCKGIKKKLGNVLGNHLCNRKKETISLMLCRKLKKYLQGSMKSCKGIKKIWETCWESACATTKTKQFPLSCEEN